MNSWLHLRPVEPAYIETIAVSHTFFSHAWASSPLRYDAASNRTNFTDPENGSSGRVADRLILGSMGATPGAEWAFIPSSGCGGYRS